jgi:hypothetical protein
VPYVSQKQRAYFNVNRAKLERQGVDVNEWNKASKGLKLPKRKKKKLHPHSLAARYPKKKRK